MDTLYLSLLISLGCIGIFILVYVLKQNNIIGNKLDIDLNRKGGSSGGGGGWCYIGEFNKQKSCIDVTNKSDCMSGDIFPSQNICINNKLR